MAESTTKNEAAATKGTRGDKRRRRIMDAFHDCIISEGYAKTTLRDVASAAGMSASHLLYYFPGKDAILQQYFDDVSRRIMKRIDSIRQEDPARQLELLADLFFAGRGITNSETGFMLECFGVAVHDSQLHSEKADLDRFCKDYLQELFGKLGMPEGQRADEAEVVYAMLIGLRTAAFFDERLSLAGARRLFRDAVTSWAGFKPQA